MYFKSRFKRPIVLAVTIALFSAICVPGVPAADAEQELRRPTVGNTFIDALIYRPVGLVAVPVGAVLFVLTLPFSALGGNVGTSFNNLVAAPAKYTFVRPLGDI